MATTILGGVPLMDFSDIGKLPDVYKKAKMEANRDRTLAELGQGASIQDVSRRLFQAGDVQGGLSLANLANAQEQQRFNQGIATRQISLQEKQAEEKPQYMQIEGPNGEKKLVQIKPYGKGVSAVNPEGMESQPGNPFLTGKPGTEGQQNAQLYANRMLAAEEVLRKVESAGASWWERARGGVSDRVGYNIRGPDYQKFDQAQRDFINATLRRESGAVINPEEFANANKQYFPQPGDDKETISQKRQNRLEAIKGIGAAGGPGYRPAFTIGPGGELVRNEPKKVTKLPAGYTPQRALQEARAAIAEGRDRNAVIQHLKSLGVNPAGL